MRGGGPGRQATVVGREQLSVVSALADLKFGSVYYYALYVVVFVNYSVRALAVKVKRKARGAAAGRALEA